MSRPVIIDTDGGVDDAVALWWALTDPALDVVAITVVWGNVDIDIAVGERVARRGMPWAAPACRSRPARRPLLPAPDLRPATFIHGDDGLGNAAGPEAPGRAVDEPAVDMLVRLVRERPERVSVVTLGPLTNIGIALHEHADFAGRVAELLVMGGSARAAATRCRGAKPTSPTIRSPRSGRCSRRGSQPPLLVGLDVTLVATLRPDEFELLAEHRNAAAEFLDAPLRFYREFGSTFTAPDTPCHDLLTVLALSDPAIIDDAPLLPLAVDCGGDAAWGTTVVDFRAPVLRRPGRVDAVGRRRIRTLAHRARRRRRPLPRRRPHPLRRLTNPPPAPAGKPACGVGFPANRWQRNRRVERVLLPSDGRVSGSRGLSGDAAVGDGVGCLRCTGSIPVGRAPRRGRLRPRRGRPASAAAPVSPATTPIAARSRIAPSAAASSTATNTSAPAGDCRPGDDRDGPTVESGHDRVVRPWYLDRSARRRGMQSARGRQWFDDDDQRRRRRSGCTAAAASAPTPIGTTTTSGRAPASCSSISAKIVAYPSITVRGTSV